MGAVQRSSPRAYARLIRRLADAGMVTFTDSPREVCGLFFACKKSGLQRMAVDCRRSNCWPRRPDTAALAAGSSLGELGVPEGDELRVGHADICDAFYHIAPPEAFRDFIALPSAKAGGAGQAALRGRAVEPGARLWPVLAVLPMDWSHALFWCQTTHQSIVNLIPELSEVPFISDKSAAPSARPRAPATHVDIFCPGQIPGPSPEPSAWSTPP